MPETVKSKKKILFVDDEPDYLALIQQLMDIWSKETWDVLTADTTGKAFSLLAEHPVDLVVTDMRMPVVDGVQFIRLLNRKHPNLPKVILTGDKTEASRKESLAAGADLFLQKPTSMDGMKAVYEALNELIKIQSAEGFHGVLRQVSLQDVIQLECLKSNSSVLLVSAGAMRGKIFIKDGHIIHAQAGEQTGETAFNQLVGLKGGEFSLKPFAEPPEETIQATWESLLMEAARVADEGDGSAAAGEATPKTRGKTSKAKDGEGAQTSSATSGKQVIPTQIEELVICTPHGEVIHEWQCPNVNERIQFLELLAQKSRQLGDALALGQVDRVEMTGAKSRAVARLQNDARTLLRSAREFKAIPPARRAA